MNTMDLILSPDLKTSSIKITSLLESLGGSYDILFLNIPQEMEELVNELALQVISFAELLEETSRRRILPEPISSWEYRVKPILEKLPDILGKYPETRLLCYGSVEHEFAAVDAAVQIAALTLKTTLSKMVDIEEWHKTIHHSLKEDEKARENELKVMIENKGRNIVCIADMGGRSYYKPLTAIGFRVKIHYVVKPYPFLPIMILKRKMSKGQLRKEETEKLVRCHIEYVRKYIYKFENRDRAYYEWIYDKIPWIRQKINRREIEFLNNLLVRS